MSREDEDKMKETAGIHVDQYMNEFLEEFGSEDDEFHAPVEDMIDDQDESDAFSEENQQSTDKYDNVSNFNHVKFIKRHIKSLKLHGAIIIISKTRHNIWKLENNTIKLFYYLPRKEHSRRADNYMFAISKCSTMVMMARKYRTYEVDQDVKKTHGSLKVYKTCSQSVVARLSFPRHRVTFNQVVQVSFIHKDMYALAVSYHYDPANPPFKNHYYIDLWNIASGTHLAAESFISEVGYMPDSQFFVNESISLTYGCGAFIRAMPSIPPSINIGCVNQNNDINDVICSLSAALVCFFYDNRNDDVYQLGFQHSLVIGFEKSGNKHCQYKIWFKTENFVSSYSSKVSAISFPVSFLDNALKYIMISIPGTLNTTYAVWKIISSKANASNDSGCYMEIYEKEVVYCFGSTAANHIDRCFGMPSVLFDPSAILTNTNYALNGKINVADSFVMSVSNTSINSKNPAVLVITAYQVNTSKHSVYSNGKFNCDPNHLNFEHQRDVKTKEFIAIDRKCNVAIPLLDTSMFECCVHALINEAEQRNDITLLKYNQVISVEACGDQMIRKKDIDIKYFSQFPKFFKTIAGIQLITRLAKHERHNALLENIIKYCESSHIDMSFNTVISLKAGNPMTNALREALLANSSSNVKTILSYIAGSQHQYNFALMHKYQAHIDSSLLNLSADNNSADKKFQ